MPDTFGEYGHYRGASLEANANLPIKYAGSLACNDCHDDIYGKKSASHHQNVACEVCHGPAATHAKDPSDNTIKIPNERGYCTICHGYNSTRPTGFPQIDPAAHNPGELCFTCHDPHAPEPPQTPEQCSACHRSIAGMKALSPHAQLLCTQCHVVPEEHKMQPQLIRAEKPTSRDFCGRCHAEGADSPSNIPRVDMASHGIEYLCWQCHYPHFPEARQ